MTKNKQLVVASSPSPNRRLETKTDDKTQTFYANNASIEMSNFDVKFRLGQIQSASHELITVLDVIHVYMSHAHAKAFLDALATALKQFEQINEKAKR